MPTKKFDPAIAELHLGILQQKIQRTKGKKTQCAFILDEDNNLDREGMDLETERLNLQKYEKETKELEEALEVYEDKCLELTNL